MPTFAARSALALFCLNSLATVALLSSPCAAQDSNTSRGLTPPLTLDADEQPSGWFRVGAGFASSEGFVFNAGVGHDELFGVDRLQLRLDATLSPRREEVETRLTRRPGANDPLLLSLRSYYQSYHLGEPDERALSASRAGGDLLVGGEVAPGLILAMGYRLEHHGLATAQQWPDDFTTPDALANDAILVNALRFQIDYESPGTRRDTDLLRGFYLQGVAEAATADGRDTTLYARATSEARYGVRLPGGLHLALGGRLGRIWSDRPGNVPTLDRFRLGGTLAFLGGGQTLPALGPTIAAGPGDTANWGGTSMAHAEAVLHVPLWAEAGLYAYGGLEGGAMAWGPLTDQTLDMAAAWKAGIKWYSPIGPIGVGVSQPLPIEEGLNTGPTYFIGVGVNF